jgi:GNAT superfamily N-acetyltransferase
MSPYRLREATTDDVDTLVGHRVGMFTDMGGQIDIPSVGAAFREWVLDAMARGVYRAWVVESGETIVAGGGITILPWPPGPRYLGGRIAFVYNVYTQPAHRRRGLARRLMETIHGWCRENGIGVIGLNASDEGRPLYEALGYQPAANPLMFAAVDTPQS